jgi:hypothetical protein
VDCRRTSASAARARQLADGVIGAATNFLDTFGIGSYAQITALFKLRGRPADELIPGTLNVGSTLPAFVGSHYSSSVPSRSSRCCWPAW